MGFTDLLTRLPSGKALPIANFDDEFEVASIDKIQKMLSNKPHSNFVTLNTVDRQVVAVNTYTLVNTIPSRIEISSDVIGQNVLNSSLVFFNLKIIAAIISCIARSIKICHNYHSRTENCTSNCLPIVTRNSILKALPLRTMSCYILYSEIDNFYHLLKNC